MNIEIDLTNTKSASLVRAWRGKFLGQFQPTQHPPWAMYFHLSHSSKCFYDFHISRLPLHPHNFVIMQRRLPFSQVTQFEANKVSQSNKIVFNISFILQFKCLLSQSQENTCLLNKGK